MICIFHQPHNKKSCSTRGRTGRSSHGTWMQIYASVRNVSPAPPSHIENWIQTNQLRSTTGPREPHIRLSSCRERSQCTLTPLTHLTHLTHCILINSAHLSIECDHLAPIRLRSTELRRTSHIIISSVHLSTEFYRHHSTK